MKEPFWTVEMVDRLAAMLAGGATYQRIGDCLGCGKNAAIGKARRLGIDAGPGPDPRTLHDRMDAEHARMDAVLAETESAVAAAKRRIAVEMAGAAE